jgi:hypothetical protein
MRTFGGFFRKKRRNRATPFRASPKRFANTRKTSGPAVNTSIGGRFHRIPPDSSEFNQKKKKKSQKRFVHPAGNRRFPFFYCSHAMEVMCRGGRGMEYNEAAAKMRKTLKSSPIYAHLAPFRGNLFGFKCSPNQSCLSKCVWRSRALGL